MAARRLGETYSNVIVTAGARGLAGVTAEKGTIMLPARKVDVVSSHGAGDCFTGTFAAALARGHDLASACMAASDAAAEHVSRPVQ